MKVILLVFFSVSYAFDGSPRAFTENGPVVGVFETSYSGKVFEAYKGIRYAKPPIGDKRFKDPKRIKDNWVGEWDAKSYGSECLQLDQRKKTRIENDFVYAVHGSEDCLFINIFTHSTVSANKTVIFNIHGGSFMFGSGKTSGPQFIMDYEDFVCVTFNYRLGPLGFLSTQDYVIPGNSGLKDQAAALAWVKRNIAHFGGDPKKITINGLSSGGACVDLMYFSPQTNGLFIRGSSFSGTSLCPWSIVEESKERTKKLATLVGCPIDDSRTILKCLRNRPANLIVEKVSEMLEWLLAPYVVFGPVVEVNSSNPYIDEHPRDILKAGKGKDLPWLTTLNSEEGSYPAGEFILDEALMEYLKERQEKLLPATLIFDSTYPTEERSVITDRLKKYLFGSEILTKENREKALNIYSNLYFLRGTAEVAKMRSITNKQPVFLYMNAFRSGVSLGMRISGKKESLGVCHGDDYINIVKYDGLEYNWTEEEKKVGQIIRDIFLSFCMNSTVPQKYNWPPINGKSKFQYLLIKSSTDLKISNDEFLDSMFKIPAREMKDEF